MIKMVEPRTVKGDLYCDNDNGEEYDRWKLYGKVEWNGEESQVFSYLEDTLSKFEGQTVEITIKVIEGPQ